MRNPPTINPDSSNGETIWHVDFDNSEREQYVLAPSKRKVHTILKRMFSRPRYDFEWEEYSIEDLERTDIEPLVRGSEPPFSVLEARRYYIFEHEKRVNQGGYKGVYTRHWHR